MRSRAGRLGTLTVTTLLVTGLTMSVTPAATAGADADGVRARHPRSRVQIVAPADRSQADATGTVPIDIQLRRGAKARSLRVWLANSRVNKAERRRVEITERLVVRGDHATATVHADDLQPGLTTVTATAKRGGEHRRRHGGARETSTFSWEPALDLATADRCEILDSTRCLLPFPSNFFTAADDRTDTGRRVSFPADSMNANSSGERVDPTEWNRNDGFSPGTPVLTFVPGLDLARSGAAPITDIGASLRRNQPIVLLDAHTGERQPFWAELDQQAEAGQQMLFVRPARNLREGHTYVVALRRLRDAGGALIEPSRSFRLYRDDIPTFAAAVEARRPHMERVFRTLAGSGVDREELYLAWDFTVASGRNIAGRVLHMRDDAFASLDGGVPSFTVTSVENEVDDRIYRRVSGTVRVPNYLTGTGAAGSRLNYANDDPDALPQRNGDLEAGFICNIPRWATADGGDPVRPARGGVYGHGLLGSNDEVNAGNVRTMANTHGFVFCATKWAGFSEDDILTIVQSLQNFTNFPKVPDRAQQGFLNFMFLARLVRDPRGFAANPAFQAGTSNTPVLDGTVFYDGNSQGGIMGGAVTALSTEWTRAVLGVTGMNYSTLLQRSKDFDLYDSLLRPNYPDEMDRLVGFAVAQMLWDRGEANGFAQHMTDDPYPGTPRHQVLLHVAFGDHQVANVTAEVEARTIGARLLQPGLASGRSPDVVPFWGIRTVPRLPWDGSAMVMWDSGNPAPPLGNIPPRAPEYGEDPHEFPRRAPAAQQQKSDFLKPDGALIDTCGGAPCLAPPA